MAPRITYNRKLSEEMGYPLMGITERFAPRVPVNTAAPMRAPARTPGRVLELSYGNKSIISPTRLPDGREFGVNVGRALRGIAATRPTVAPPMISSNAITPPGSLAGNAGVVTAPRVPASLTANSMEFIRSIGSTPSQTGRNQREFAMLVDRQRQQEAAAKEEAFRQNRFIDTPRAVAATRADATTTAAATRADASKTVARTRLEGVLYGANQRLAGTQETNKTRANIANDQIAARLELEGVKGDAKLAQIDRASTARMNQIEAQIGATADLAEKADLQQMLIEEFKAKVAAATTTRTLTGRVDAEGKPIADLTETTQKELPSVDNDGNGIPDNARWTDPVTSKPVDMNKVVNFINAFELRKPEDPIRQKYAAQYELFKKQRAAWLSEKTKPKE
jgi:hypothetical protein